MRQCMDLENLHRRLKKIIGQVQAIDRMIDEDVPSTDAARRCWSTCWSWVESRRTPPCW